MSNLVHLVSIDRSGIPATNPIDLHLGTVATDTIRNNLTGLVVGNTIVVSNSASAGGGPAFYHWNGTTWQLVASFAQINAWTTFISTYTVPTIPIYMPIDALIFFSGITSPTPGYLVVVKNDTSVGNLPSLYVRSTVNTWVRIASAQETANGNAAWLAWQDFNTNTLPLIRSWREPKANMAALNAIAGPTDKDVHYVEDDGFGVPSIYRYNLAATKFNKSYLFPYADKLADLAVLNSDLVTQNIKNAIYYCRQENSIYRFNPSTPAWEIVAGGGTNPGSQYLVTNVTATTNITITHNFNKYPAVTILNNTGQQVEALVTHSTLNQISINFNASFTGKVICK